MPLIKIISKKSIFCVFVFTDDGGAINVPIIFPRSFSKNVIPENIQLQGYGLTGGAFTTFSFGVESNTSKFVSGVAIQDLPDEKTVIIPASDFFEDDIDLERPAMIINVAPVTAGALGFIINYSESP